jgi:hypothetical protein
MLRGLIAVILLIFSTSAVAQIPANANAHKRDLTRIVQQEFGLNGNVALHAAQIHQESAWRTEVGDGRVKSSVGAQGFAQFMPATATWIAELYPDLGEAAPFSPTWAFRAMARYNKWHMNRVVGHTDCDKWWFSLRAYNGGLGHLRNESNNATDKMDRHSVDAACGTARRSRTHCPENLGYPDRIINRHEPRYLAAGWAGAPTCPAAPSVAPTLIITLPEPIITTPVPEPIFMTPPELYPEPEPVVVPPPPAAQPEPMTFWQWLRHILRDRTQEISINS